MSHIVLFGTRFCPFVSLRARGYSAPKASITRILHSTTDPEAKRSCIAKSGRNTVPQIWFGTEHIGGFDELRDLERQGTFDRRLQAGLEMR